MSRRRSDSEYGSLLDGIEDILTSGRQLGRDARGHRLARTYWGIGDAIHSHLLANEGRTAYGERLFQRLSIDINLYKTLIYTMVRLRRRMPNVETFPQLTWSHCIQILPLETLREREFYARVASGQSWNVRELKLRIRENLYSRALQTGSASYLEASAATAAALTPRRGQLYTYRLLEALPGETSHGEFVLDLGFFSIWSGALEGLEKPKRGDVTTAEKYGGGAGDRYRFTLNRRRGRKLYTVRAVIERVVDGDTLLARLDCSFRSIRRERLRLRGIDTAELYSSAGQLARTFVQDALAAVEFVVVCSSGRDLYGRYLSDVFYLPGADDPAEVLTDGIFLNRQLLDEGLAEPYLS